MSTMKSGRSVFFCFVLFRTVLTVNFSSTRYRVEEGDGSVEVCARMVGLNAKDIVINMSTNDSIAKRT